MEKTPRIDSFGKVCSRLGRTLKRLRKGRSMTQEEMATRAGIGWRHLQKIEAGEVNVTLRTLYRLGSSLRVDLGTLLCDRDHGQ
jgi:transcriptional regulator with XRE-family HTH domain